MAPSKVEKKHVLKFIALKQRSAVIKEKKSQSTSWASLYALLQRVCPLEKDIYNSLQTNFFSISTVFSTHPPSYILRDEKGQEIQGNFYEAEIIKVLK